MNKPELLLPVGNVEAFYAAMKGGADAVYVGLKAFNARGRAANFNNFQFLLLLAEAKKSKVKVYVTLNTVIKNREMGELLDTLWFLSKTTVAAVIIQDWGTYYLLKNFFPKLVIHASTQMANHNSSGAKHCQTLGIERVILARELTLPELEVIQEKSPIETEVFVHGALCYSFSGMCMFSSYLGGSGANRGLCTQPCRRYYAEDKEQKLAFSLKDNQLITLVPKMAEMGIASLKIEGRLKSGEYVYRVAKAYRDVIDDPKNLAQSQEALELDMGRPKTQWFYEKNVSQAISENPNTGVLIGEVSKVGEQSISFVSDMELSTGNRLRIKINDANEQLSIKVTEVSVDEDGISTINNPHKNIRRGNQVFLAGIRQEKFPSKLKGNANKVSEHMPQGLKSKAIGNTRQIKPQNKQTIFVRIDSLKWLRKLRLEDVDELIIQLPKKEWPEFNADAPFLKKNQHKIWIELPQFIGEKEIPFYEELCRNLSNKGYKQFSLSHLSQKLYLPKGSKFITNENVYCYNDAAAKHLYNEGAKWCTSPFENEFDNLLSGANRKQIIPMHYRPKLFYSRQPVKIEEEFKDDENHDFTKSVINGITIVTPNSPVSLFQYREKLSKKGFNQFLIDLSFDAPSKHTLKRLMGKFKKSEQEQPSTTFNFKKGLK